MTTPTGHKIIAGMHDTSPLLVEFTHRKGEEHWFTVINGAWDGFLKRMGEEWSMTVQRTGTIIYPVYVHPLVDESWSDYNRAISLWEKSRASTKSNLHTS